MSFIGFLIILAISLTFSFLFVFLLSSRGPWNSFWTFFIILFLGIWAISLWIEPIGPIFGGISWTILLVAGLILALLLAITGTSETKKQKRNAITGRVIKEAKDPANRLSIFFWLLLILFTLAIVVGIYL